MTIEELIAKWWRAPGGQEKSNFSSFIPDLCEALGVPRPGAAEKGKLGAYEYEASIPGGSFRSLKGSGAIDLYRRGHFVMEAKQSWLKPEQAALDLAPDESAPRAPSGARYDGLMREAWLQARNYARNLPGSEPPAPFLIVCDVGRAFELYVDPAGNGRDYEFFPDKQSYRIELHDLASDAEVARTGRTACELLRAIWTDPKSVDPRFHAAEVTRKVARNLASVSKYLEEGIKAKALSPHQRALETEESSLFLMRILFCMFAEDIGLLPDGKFKNFLKRAESNDGLFAHGLRDLFEKMNNADPGNRFAHAVESEVRYFNGGLFESSRTYPLGGFVIHDLYEAAKQNWRRVEPAIFGTLLEQALDVNERAKLGAHYTPRPYVETLVRATILDVLEPEWEAVEEEIERLRSSPGRGGGPRAERGVEGHVQAAPEGKDSEQRLVSLRHASHDPPPPAGEDQDALAIAQAFHDRLASIRVLDPACGTGNFLYVAMELLQALESRVIERIETLGGEAAPRVGPQQFYGLELNPRAAKIAELVLWIGWLRNRLKDDPGAVPEPVLQRSANLNRGRPGRYDALLRLTDTGEPDYDDPVPAAWPEAEFIVGNPPFIGGKDLRERLGGDYAEAMWAANSRVPKSADFVMQWWDRAAHALVATDSPLVRFGFVTTNSITQEFSRRVIAGYLAKGPEIADALASAGGDSPPTFSPDREGGNAAGIDGGDSPQAPDPAANPLHHPADGPPPPKGEDRISIVMAIPDHPWTKATKDAAAVRIAMTVAERGAREGTLREVTGEAKLDSDAPEIALADAEGRINANLTVGADAASAKPLLANEGLSSPGVKLHGSGFIVSESQAKELGLGRRDGLERHIRPYRNGRDLLQNPRGAMVIDLFGLTEKDVRQRFPEVYQHLDLTIRTQREQQVAKSPTNDAKAYARTWWIHGKPRSELRPALDDLDRYIATVETSKHRIFQFLDAEILPDNMLVAIGSEDAFHLGVLQSRIHTDWALRAGGSLEDRPRYNKTKIFDPFPFPDASDQQRAAIAELAEELDGTRKLAIAETDRLTMTELYNLRDWVRSSRPSPLQGRGS